MLFRSIDNETILMDNRGETGLTDLRPGQMVKLWVRDDNPYLLETGAHLASQVLVMSAPEEVSLWLEDEQRKTITTLTNIVLTDWQQTNDDAQKISLQKVNHRFFIAELIPEGMNHWESGLFYLFDTKEKNLRQLPFGGKLTKRYQVIMLEGHTLTLLVENFAQIHGHQIFPYLLRYNVLTGNYTERPYYASLYEEFTLGGKHKMALRAIETNNHGNIYFRYELIEGAELVGGLHTPTVHIPSILSSRGMFEEENIFTVDFENVYLTDAVYNNIEELRYHPNITNLYISEYTDAFDKNHVVIFLALENTTAYTTGFKEREDAISDFYIMFK